MVRKIHQSVYVSKMMPPPVVVVVVFRVSSSAMLCCCVRLCCCGRDVCAMCARGLLGESEVVTLMLLAQRRRAWAACNRVILPLRVAERWRTPHALLSGALEDKDDGKTQ